MKEDDKSILEKLGGPRRVILLVVGFVAATSFYHWQTAGSGTALQEVGAELGLQVSQEGQRWQLNGRIDDIGVKVKTTTENTGGDTHWFTDFQLYAPDQPHGRIIGASLRQKVIGGLQGADRLLTGDSGFDSAVFVEGDPAEMLPHLDAEARVAVRAATDAGWALESVAWTARESGRMTNAKKVRNLLDLGLAAAKALGREGDLTDASQERAVSDPSPDVLVAGAATHAGKEGASLEKGGDLSGPVTATNALEVLSEVNTSRSLEAALFLARSGDDRQEVRNRLVSAVYAGERMDEVIRVLGEIGGQLETVVLNSVKGEHEETAKTAIASIKKRL